MIELKGKFKDLGGGLTVARVLPAAGKRMVGPFIFFDHFGPVEFAPGDGFDVRPHPHIGLATVTYVFEGGQVHRDSLGTELDVLPGDVNWMTAGRGIVHSERTGAKMRGEGHRLHGIQSWVALPEADEDTEPMFQHADAADLPTLEEDGVSITLLVGSAFGLEAPLKTFSPIFYCDVSFAAGARFTLGAEHEERGIYVVDGPVEIDGTVYDRGEMVVCEDASDMNLTTDTPARVMFLGGAAMGPRHIYWNFVASSKERIEQAKADWREKRFPVVPTDREEFIPLPD